MRALIALPVLAFLAFASAECRADDPPAPPPAEESAPPAHVWYGYQTLGTDAVAIALLIPAAANANSAGQQGFEVGSLLMYTAAAPIVHFAHGHVIKGFADLGLRVGLPVVGAVAGVGIAEAIQPPSSGSTNLLADVLIGGFLGTSAGVIGAMTIDAALLGRETVPQDQARPASQPLVASLAPTFSIVPESQGGSRTSFGLVGTF